MMKKLLFGILLFLGFQAMAQVESENNAVYIPCSEFHITKPLKDIFSENPVDEDKVNENEESQDKKWRIPQRFPNSVLDNPKYGNDASIMQRAMGEIPNTKAPIINTAGQSATGFRPMDPSGAAGPNHYVQMINSTTFRIYNKTTMSVLLTGTLGSLWSPATGNAGDPIVMYDKDADRWFLAQFGSGNQMYIAVSQTSDPTGAYYTYTYISPAFPDYLKFSVWADGYYMTSNQAQKVFAFERNAMLAGVSSAKSLYVSFSPPEGSGFFCPLPGDAADGTLPTVGTPCPIFSYSDDGWGTGFSDAINIYQMSVNWTPATPTGNITLAANVPTAAFDASYNSSWNDVSQPGTTQKLDGIGGVLMYRAQWKSWTGYNTVVLNWGVYINSTQRSIMWCELRQNQSTGVWSMYQQGIYTPDAATRWMGSIVMDNNGSIGLAYMKSDASNGIYPSLGYAGRKECDPLGTLPIAETMVIAGTGYQTGTNRVGDYSHSTLDPDGVTIWHTSEYFGGTSGGSVARTQIFSYQLASCSNNASVSISQTSGNNPACAGESLTFTATPFNGGTAPTFQWKVNGTNVGTNSPTFTTSSLTNGQTVTCVMTSNLVGVLGNPATSNAILITVNTPAAPSISISTLSSTICAGTSVTFTASITNGGTSPSYQWKVNGSNVGSNSSTYSTTALTNGQIVTCVLTSNSTCATSSTATSNGITMNVTGNGTPSVIISSIPANPCVGQTVTFSATPTNGGSSPSYQWKVNGSNVGTNSPTFSSSTLTNGQVVSCVLSAPNVCPLEATLGTSTSQNTTTNQRGAAYPTYYGNGRQQYIIRASELTALGFSAGDITSVAFNVGNTVGNPATLNGYTIKMANTSASTATTTFLSPTFTTVFGPVNYTPTLTSWNVHNFSTPFIWDGTSNVIVDICFSNQVTGTVAYRNYYSTASFTSSTYYQADGSSGAGACTQATTTSTTTNRRPNMKLTNVLNATANSNPITVSISSSVTPSVSISTTSSTICSGTNVSFTATPTNGGTPAYQWKVNGVNVGSNSSSFSSSTLTNGQTVTCVMTSTAPCASPTTVTSNGIIMTVNPCQSNLNLTVFIQGYYQTPGTMKNVLYNQGVELNPSNHTDSVTVELHQASSPYSVVESYKNIIQTNGTIACQFSPATLGNSYYIVVKHWNSIETWSATPITLASNSTYNFASSPAQAYGNNQALMAPNMNAIYSGDVTQDGVIDIFDFLEWDIDNQNFIFGRTNTDLDGDGIVDIFDFLIWDPNSNNFIGVIQP